MRELAQTKQRGENMEFGVFDHLDRYGGALADYYEDRLRIVEAYDRADSTPTIWPSITRRRSAWRLRRACS